jgi:O-antigen/teichoic acid export membrane protein
MSARRGLNVSTDVEQVDTAAKVAKNSAAMFVVAILNNGVGLIVAVVVARYLGPAALGTYAVVMGLAVLFEQVAPLGQRYVVIREVARDRSRLFSYWVNVSLVTLASSIVLGIVLVVFVHVAGYDMAVLTPVYVVALYLPVAGLSFVSRAAVQGMEQMEYLIISAFIGSVLGLLALWVLLELGAGVEAAFVGRGLLLLTDLLILAWVMLRLAGQHGILSDWRPRIDLWRPTLGASLPFAMQNFLNMALNRVNTIILPLLVTMAAVGIFDAADRVRQTSAMIIPVIMLAILPTLSRTFVADREKAVALLEKALKVLLVVIFPFVFLVAIAADEIIPLLYGRGYEAAIPVLRIVIWAQVFFVADAVLNQAMMASNNERPMMRRTALSLGASVILTLLLAPRYGVVGAAWAVVVTRALNLGLDAQFVARHITRVNVAETVGRPLLCAALSAVVAFALRGQALWLLVALSISSYAVFLLIFRAFSPDEFLLVRQLSTQLWQRVVTLKR